MLEDFCENGIIIPENLIKNNKTLSEIETKNTKKIKNKILFQTSSDFHDITVCENQYGKFLKYGISIQSGIINTIDYTGNIPYLNYFLINYILKPKAKRILVIGFGIGLLVKQLYQLYGSDVKIDGVDIEENILDIAKKYFYFKEDEHFNFYLQDALVFLRNNNKKYDIIITDVAGDMGIDKRFFEDDFFVLIKKSLKKGGIFSFNSCAETTFLENENTFFSFTIKQYKKHFKTFAVFNGKTSTEIYYNSIYGINPDNIGVTNAIFFASDKNLIKSNWRYTNKNLISDILNLGIDIRKYLKNIVHTST